MKTNLIPGHKDFVCDLYKRVHTESQDVKTSRLKEKMKNLIYLIRISFIWGVIEQILAILKSLYGHRYLIW